MSEREESTQYAAAPHAPADALNGLLADRPFVEREGLPRGYRMRADSHYVDQLEARQSPPPIRLINTRQLEGAETTASLAKLIESIAAHGVLQPLLVRRQNGHYQVIAGRKRLAAAIAAGVTDVPCVTYDVDDATAAALAEADNVRAPLQEPDRRKVNYVEVLRTVTQDLRGITTAVETLTRTHGGVLPPRVSADIIQAQAWRAAWLSDAAAVVGQQHRGSRPVSIDVILDRVRTQFEPHARLTGLRLEYGVSRMPASVLLDQELGMIAVSGCIFATLAWLDETTDATIEVRADMPNARTLKVEVVQRLAPPDDEASRILRETSPPRTRNVTMAMGLLAARAVAARQGGTIELAPIGAGGSVLRLTFTKPAEN